MSPKAADRIHLRYPKKAPATLLNKWLPGRNDFSEPRASVMLKPLPFADAGRLVQLWLDDGKDRRTPPANTLLEQWRESRGRPVRSSGRSGARENPAAGIM
jgi:hypothetical protein